MREGVGDVGVAVQVGRVDDPSQQRVVQGALQVPRVGCWSGWPVAGASAQRLHPFKSTVVGWLTSVDVGGWAANRERVSERGILDVTVTVVAELDEVVGSRIVLVHPRVHRSHPGNVGSHVGRASSEVSSRRLIEESTQFNVVDLGAEVDPTVADVQASGDVVDPRVHHEVGPGAPSGCKSGEESHLLTTALAIRELVDNSRSGVSSYAASRTELGDLPGRSWVGDRRRIMPYAL